MEFASQIAHCNGIFENNARLGLKRQKQSQQETLLLKYHGLRGKSVTILAGDPCYTTVWTNDVAGQLFTSQGIANVITQLTAVQSKVCGCWSDSWGEHQYRQGQAWSRLSSKPTVTTIQEKCQPTCVWLLMSNQTCDVCLICTSNKKAVKLLEC